MVVFVAGEAPIRGTQILYFMDPVFFRARENPAACQRFDREVRRGCSPHEAPPDASAGFAAMPGVSVLGGLAAAAGRRVSAVTARRRCPGGFGC